MRSFLIIALLLVAIVGAKKYCGSDYNAMRTRTCTFAQQSSPCLSSDDSAIRTKCCNKGCSITDIQQACCFTDQCLNRCYPNRNRKQSLGQVY